MVPQSCRRALLFLAAASLLLAGVLPAHAQTTAPPSPTTGTPEERAAAITRPAVVYIEQYWKAWVKVPANSDLFFQGYVNGGDPFTWGTRCSGFIVEPTGYIVTAGHCVDTGEEGARGTALEFAVGWLADNGWIFRRDSAAWLNEAHLLWGVEGEERGSPPDLEVYIQRGVAAGGLQTGQAFPARVVDFQPWSEGDVALLKIEQADLPVVLIAPSSEIDIGTPVLSVGYPGSTDFVTDQSYEPTFKDGQINAQKTREGGLLPVYEMSAALSGGMSGGPTVDMSGAVVGVNSFNISGETEAFNFITPSSLVAEVLARNGVTNALGPIDESYRAGVDAFFTGDYQTAIAKFDEVLALSPTHAQAQEYKVEATKLAASQPSPTATGGGTGGATAEGGGFPTWAIAVIVAAAVIIVLLVLLLARRGRRAPAAVAPVAQVAQAVAAPPVAPPPAVGAPMPPPQQEPAKVGFQPPTGPAGVAEQPVPGAESATPKPAQPQLAEEAPHFCSNCGHQIEAGVRFCGNCGHQIGS
jgi:S1-C subfamily serine protease